MRWDRFVRHRLNNWPGARDVEVVEDHHHANSLKRMFQKTDVIKETQNNGPAFLYMYELMPSCVGGSEYFASISQFPFTFRQQVLQLLEAS